MVIFVISEHPAFWDVHRYSEQIAEVASGLADEESALEIALREAKTATPSQILRIALDGSSRVVAEFE